MKRRIREVRINCFSPVNRFDCGFDDLYPSRTIPHSTRRPDYHAIHTYQL